jgi:hypothetical protein
VKLATVNRIVAKYQAIINYLVKSGALLTHINPVSLLGLEDHLVAQEQELKKIEGNRFTINVLSDATKVWTDAWLEGCKAGWMEILFQCLPFCLHHHHYLLRHLQVQRYYQKSCQA